MMSDRVRLMLGDVEYAWQELAPEASGNAGWAHHGVAVLEDGDLVVGAPDQASLVRLDRSGRERGRAATGLVEMHGLTASRGGEEVVWVADNGQKATPGQPRYGTLARAGRVVALTLAGSLARELELPEIAAYERAPWKPCAVAVDEVVDGGSGDIWVADGYGESLLHRYSGSGRLLGTFDARETGTAFDTPHDVIVDRRRGVPEVYVADRSNRRLVVFDLEGRFLRTAGTGSLSSPSGLATSGQLLFVAELRGRVAVLDGNDQLLGYLGASDAADREGWPNAVDGQGDTIPVPDLHPGSFNSPHGISTDANGAVYVSEWLIGGRIVRLAPSS